MGREFVLNFLSSYKDIPLSSSITYLHTTHHSFLVLKMPIMAQDTVYLVYRRIFKTQNDPDGSLETAGSIHRSLKDANTTAEKTLMAASQELQEPNVEIASKRSGTFSGSLASCDDNQTYPYSVDVFVEARQLETSDA